MRLITWSRTHPSTPPGIAEYLPSMVDSIERDLLDCFADPVAEAVYRRTKSDKFIWGSGRGDRCRGYELISLLPARKLLDAESQAIVRSSCLVRRYWPAVTAVADLLQEHGTVNGEAITALLCEVTGESPARLTNDLATLDTRRKVDNIAQSVGTGTVCWSDA